MRQLQPLLLKLPCFGFCSGMSSGRLIGSHEAPTPLRVHQDTSREPVRKGVAVKSRAGVCHSEQITREDWQKKHLPALLHPRKALPSYDVRLLAMMP